jgi:hypothetical protein
MLQIYVKTVTENFVYFIEREVIQKIKYWRMLRIIHVE